MFVLSTCKSGAVEAVLIKHLLPLQQYMDEVQRGYTWTPVNGTDYR